MVGHDGSCVALASEQSHRTEAQRREVGILRGQDDDNATSSKSTLTTLDTMQRQPPQTALPNVAFLEGPRPTTERSTQNGELEGQGVMPHDSDELVFARRPLPTSGRSSFSCSACTSPKSPLSEATNLTMPSVAAVSRACTPSLCRSETESSDPALSSILSGPTAGEHVDAASHHQGSHVQDESSRVHSHRPQQVSLLSAALLAGETSPPTKARANSACGILRKVGEEIPHKEVVHEAPGKVSFAGHVQDHRGSNFQPSAAALKRNAVRRVSLPPTPTSGPRFSVSPDHYSEGPESPPRPLMFDAQAHAAFLPQAFRTTQSPSQVCTADVPAKRRALVFQDAAGVAERAKARQQAGTGVRSQRSHDALSQTTHLAPLRVETEMAERVHPCDLTPIRNRSPSPARGPLMVHGDSSPVATRDDRAQSLLPAERKLTFAASPSELKSTPRGRLRKARSRPCPTSMSAPSDDEGPYFDSVQASSAHKRRGHRHRDYPAQAPKSRLRTGSPAPKRLGGPEGKRGSGVGRPRSPAPRGRVALPTSLTSDISNDDGSVDEDDLDYDEDDEDDSDECSEEEEEDDDDDDDEDEDEDDADDDRDIHASGSDGTGSSGSESDALEALKVGQASGPKLRRASKSIAVPRPSSSRRSVDSQSHPAAFSHSDFEEDIEGLRASDGEFGCPASYELPLVHSRQRSPAPFRSSFSHHGSPFVRSRISTPAISDIEGMASHNPIPISTRAGESVTQPRRSSRPSLSPVRARSTAPRLEKGAVVPLSLSARSISTSAVGTSQRCAPSTLASPEQAHGGLSASPSQVLTNSPDAWTALRACLESAIMGDDQEASRLSDVQQGRFGLDSLPFTSRRNSPWSALGSPAMRSAVMSPGRLTDVEEHNALNRSARSEQSISRDHLGLDPHFRHLQTFSAALDSGSSSANRSRSSSPQLLAKGRTHSATRQPEARLILEQTVPADSASGLGAPAQISDDANAGHIEVKTETSERERPRTSKRSKPIRIRSGPAAVSCLPAAESGHLGDEQGRGQMPAGADAVKKYDLKPDHFDIEYTKQRLRKLKARRRPYVTSSSPRDRQRDRDDRADDRRNQADA